MPTPLVPKGLQVLLNSSEIRNVHVECILRRHTEGWNAKMDREFIDTQLPSLTHDLTFW